MALRDIFQAVNVELESDCTVAFGADQLEEHAVPPKITWVPGEFTFAPHQRQGLSGSRHPRSLWTKRQRVEIHCWAADSGDTRMEAQFAAAEELVDRAVWAIHRACAGSYELGASIPLDSGVASLGVVMVLTVFFLVPVVEPADRRQLVTTPILDVSSTTGMANGEVAPGVPAAVTGVAVFGLSGTEDEVEGTPAP